MKSTTIFGLIAGVVAIIGAMIFKHISFSVLLNPAAFLVIFLGTVACILNAFPGKDLKNLGKLFKIIITEDSKKSHTNKIELIHSIVELSKTVRQEGILSLESKLDTIEDTFMRKGLRMVVDGVEAEQVFDVLYLQIEEIESRHNTNASIFSQAGAYAPTLGVLGAVFGLIAAMSNINDIDMMAEAVAAAFIATILGIFTGYVLWNPFANKLKALSRHEITEKRMTVEGIVSLARGEAPYLIEYKLLTFLSETEEENLQGQNDKDKGDTP